LTTPWWALRIGLGGAAFLAGLDKFFNMTEAGVGATVDEPVAATPRNSIRQATV
jgi:hypothetical protein